jgi:carbamoyl-phosphate synthase large subunit
MNEAILVTSIGAKLPLLRVLKNARDAFDGELKIIGADSNAAAVARDVVDSFWQMPPLEALGFDGVLAFAHQNRVRYVIPTRDAELLFFARHKAAFASFDIAVFVADEAAAAFCYDKLRFFEQDESAWTIPTYLDVNAVQTERVVVKERFGSGAKNILLNASKEEARNFSKELENPIFQPFVEGREFSVDCYVDRSGICRSVVTRSRDVVVDGESQVTTIAKERALTQKAAAFVERHKLQGHSVLQVLQNATGTRLIECNARFGGASTLSEHVGLKSFLWFLREANGMAFEVSLSPKIIRQTRTNREDSYSER